MRSVSRNGDATRGAGFVVAIALSVICATMAPIPSAQAMSLYCGLRANGCYAHNGIISIYAGPMGTFKIKGAIRDRWGAMGWENSILGYPVSNEFCGLRNGGCGTRFEFDGGIMYWTGSTGSHFVKGLIGAKYASMGWEASIFGYPTTDEFCGLVRGGCGNHFQNENGSIYYSPGSGTHRVQGLIKSRWAQLGWERGELGYPRTDEYLRDGGVFQEFEGGWLAWNGGDVYGEPWPNWAGEANAKFGSASEEDFASARKLVAE